MWGSEAGPAVGLAVLTGGGGARGGAGSPSAACPKSPAARGSPHRKSLTRTPLYPGTGPADLQAALNGRHTASRLIITARQSFASLSPTPGGQDMAVLRVTLVTPTRGPNTLPHSTATASPGREEKERGGKKGGAERGRGGKHFHPCPFHARHPHPRLYHSCPLIALLQVILKQDLEWKSFSAKAHLLELGGIAAKKNTLTMNPIK